MVGLRCFQNRLAGLYDAASKMVGLRLMSNVPRRQPTLLVGEPFDTHFWILRFFFSRAVKSSAHCPNLLSRFLKSCTASTKSATPKSGNSFGW